MNRIYRLIWNTALNCWMVASEHTKGRSKRARTVGSAAVGVALVLAMPAYASEPLEELIEEETGQQVFQPPMAPSPFAFASRAVSQSIDALSLHQQLALVTDANYRDARVDGTNLLILGSRSVISGERSVAYGNGITSYGKDHVTVGYGATASSSYGTAVGTYATVGGGDGATAFGNVAKAWGRNAIAVGSNARVDTGPGMSGIAIGADSSVGSQGWTGATAVGGGAGALYDGLALGYRANALANGSVALGTGSITREANTVSVGSATLKRKIINLADGAVNATSTDAVTGKQLHAIAQVGSETAKFFKVSTVSSDVAAHASGIGSVSIGGTSSAHAAGSVAIGASAVAGASSGGNGSIAIGWRANAAAGGDIAFGSNSVANSKNAPGTTNKDFSASIGSGASVIGGRSLAVGNGASVQGEASTADMRGLAVGNGAAVNAMTGTALGYEASATAQGAVALGANSQAGTSNTVSVGNASLKRKIVNVADGEVSAGSSDAVTGKQLHAITSGPNVILGQSATTAGGYAIAIGARSSVNTGGGVGGIALGADARAGTPGYSGAMALGGGADASYDGVAVGHDAKAQAGASVALGRSSVANVGNTVSVGNDTLKRRIVNVAAGTLAGDSTDAVNGSQLHYIARVTGDRTAVGADATASGTYGTAVGQKATASGGHSHAFGTGAVASAANAMAMGTFASSASVDGIAIGNRANVATGSTSGIALGANTTAQGQSALALGKQAKATGNYTTAVGHLAKATGAWTNAIGYQADAAGNSSVAIGSLANSAAGQSVAIGDRAQVDKTASNGLALGYSSSVSANATDAVALGKGSVANAANTLSVGNATLKRKIVNVADGSEAAGSSDAITGGQLYRTNQAVTAADSKATAASNVAAAASTTAQTAERVANAATARLNSDSMQLGSGATAGTNASSMGKQAAAAGSHSNAIGAYAASAGANAIAMGTYAAGASDSAVAVGNRAGVDATSANSVALGANAKVNANANNAIALGAGSVASAKDTVSVGSTSLQRKVVNVADGALTSTSTDAVTGKQLFAATQKLDDTDSKLTVTTATANTAKTTAERAGTTATDALTKANALGGLLSQASATASVRLGADNAGTVLDVRNKSNGGRVVTGLNNGAVTNTSTDAVTGKQLFAQQQSVNANTSKIGANEGGIAGNQTGIGKNRDDIAGNRAGIGDNRIAIDALRSDFNAYVPELEGVVMFNADRTRVDMEGARVTGLLEGDVSLRSKDAVTGGQLFESNVRISELEEQHQYLVVGSDQYSEKARAGIVAVAIGDSAEASLSTEGATAVGSFAKARGENSVALGRAAHVHEGASQGFALGTASQVEVSNGVAVGAGSMVKSGASNSVALGYASIADEANSISVGHSTYKRRLVNVASGRKADDATTVAQLNETLVGLGGGAKVGTAGEIVAPTYNLKSGTYRNVGAALSALDGTVTSTREGVDTLEGRLNRLFQEEATARTDGPGRLNLGGANGMVLGNVANGMISAGSRDAVNGGQLYEVRKDLQGQIDNLAEGEKRVAVRGRMAAPAPMSVEGGGEAAASADAPASTPAPTPTPTPTPVASEASAPEPAVKAEGDTAVAVGSEGKERSVKHVAKGTADTDAVNVAQLNDVLVRSNEYTDQAVEGLNKRLDGMDKRFNRMAAMSSAQSAMAMNTAGLNTYNRLGAGVGHSDGESALAVGYQRVMNERGSATFSLNGAFTNSGEKTVGVGVGIGW